MMNYNEMKWEEMKYLRKNRKCAYKRNIEARYGNSFCNKYCILWVWMCVCVCVCVALVIQHAMHMRHIAICALPRSTIVFHIIS